MLEERARLSVCAYHLAGVCAVLSGRALERVRLSFGKRGCSAERILLVWRGETGSGTY